MYNKKIIKYFTAMLGEHSRKELMSRGRDARFFNQSLRSWEKSAGFSLIELVITLAIIVVIASVGFLSLTNYSRLLKQN